MNTKPVMFRKLVERLDGMPGTFAVRNIPIVAAIDLATNRVGIVCVEDAPTETQTERYDKHYCGLGSGRSLRNNESSRL